MVKYGEIVNQNLWWKFGVAFISFDIDLVKLGNQRIRVGRRRIEPRQGDICVIRGCRQIGKTTYMKEYVSKLIGDGLDPRRILYLSVDRFFVSRRELRRAINMFLRRNRDASDCFILLDEITALKDWNLELKFLSDSGITQKARVLVTGSGGEALRKVGGQLPGRGLEGNEYYMKPLNFRDFIFQTVGRFAAGAESIELSQSLQILEKTLEGAKITMEEDLDEIINMVDIIIPFKAELEYLFEHYLRSGGFPTAINQYVQNIMVEKKVEFFEPDLVETFVRIVLGELTKYGKNEMTARQVLKEIIDKYGSRFSFTKLARDVDINRVTTSDYLDFMEKSFILSVLYAYNFAKKDLKYKGNKKVYFQDPFIFYSLKSSLTGKEINEIITETIEDEELLSKIMEGIVYTHLAINREIPYLKETNTFLWFYYDTRGKEIDNVLKKNGSYLGIEVKYRNDVTPGDATKIQEIENYIILSKEDYIETEKTLVVPVEIFLALLERSRHNL